MDARFATSSRTPRLLAISLVAVGLAGCVVGPAYKRPDVAPAQEFRSHIGPSEANSLADLPWWQVFNDTALQGLIKEGLANSYDLQTTVARIEEATAQVGIVRADLYPQVNYQALAARQKSLVPIEPPVNFTYNTFGLAASAAWEADVWGRIRHATDAARANVYAAEEVRRAVLLRLVSDIAAGYFLLIELDRELAIAQDSADTYRKTTDLFRQRFEAGRDSKLGVVRAQANLESSAATIAALQRAITQQENALCVLIGAYPRPIARGALLTRQTTPPATPVGATTALLERRPDILQAEQVMIGANAEIGVAVANYFPRIGLSALFGWEATRPQDLFKSSFNVWSLAANLSGPIFQGGRLRSAQEAQEAFWRESIAQYKKTVTVAFQETSDALIAQQTLVGQREAQERQVASLRESVDLSLQRYDAGRASYFEVLEAEQQLFPSEDALAQTQRDQLVAVVNLYKALGGGWQLKDDEWAQPH
ncbi:MAG TPA: efflux transporter outer membrane subunit [Steroidobacteraceae bacterium]|nr:efflux transporter outer membrane subunit [Steroidobacteraceae bacterium]